MNVFDELVEELKEENLLEETVMDLNRLAAGGSVRSFADAPPAATAAPATVEAPPIPEPSEPAVEDDEEDLLSAPSEMVDEQEFLRKKAMDEVSSLQMVEHVLGGIEREHMKMAPAVFDDLGVKKALHRYLQVLAEPGSEEILDAELALSKETETWFSELSKRDLNISVANIRRFCENSRPVLSSQALLSLARFYRNSPYAESVRGKFDFVMTRLFAREIGDERRKLLFSRPDTITHINGLYATWSSLSLFADGPGPAQAAEAVERFNALIREADTAENFDALINSDFFNRIRLFKEELNELFFESTVTAAAIECNVKVGNRFVELLLRERDTTDIERIEEKYGYNYDTIISNAASKTLLLLDLVKEEVFDEVEEEAEVASPYNHVTYERAPVDKSDAVNLFAVNRWLLVVAFIFLAAAAGIYYYSETVDTVSASIDQAKAVDLSGTELSEHLLEASVSTETFYGVTKPSWDALSTEQQKSVLAKAYEFAQTKNMKRVNLINQRGRTVGFAAASRQDIYAPQ